jgi:hypothetical protein
VPREAAKPKLASAELECVLPAMFSNGFIRDDFESTLAGKELLARD